MQFVHMPANVMRSIKCIKRTLTFEQMVKYFLIIGIIDKNVAINFFKSTLKETKAAKIN